MMVGDGSSMGRRAFPGRAQAIQSANLAFDVSGSLIERPVKVGDSVAGSTDRRNTLFLNLSWMSELSLMNIVEKGELPAKTIFGTKKTFKKIKNRRYL